MNDVEIIRNPAMIAGEINLIKKQTQAKVLEGAIEIGRRLQEAKGMVGHGAWADWLRENVNYSQSTADNLMRIAEEFGDEQIGLFSGKSKSETFANLSYSQAYALFSLPEPQREEFVETHDMESMSARDVTEEIKAIKAEAEAAKKEKVDAEHRIAELEESAKKANADAADAIAKGAKAATEKADALRKYKDVKKALDEASEKEKKLKDALASAQQETAEVRARLQDMEEAEPEQATLDESVTDEKKAEMRDEIREELEKEFRAKLEAARDPHIQNLQFAMNTWTETFAAKIMPEVRQLDAERRRKILSVLINQVCTMKNILEETR